ncbi:MAG: hypothetical protein VKJ02_16680 [Snowella sp.]|nr:hypothetical protein [Snowella sp.]
MPKFQCKQCGKQFSLSIRPQSCQYCGSANLIAKSRQSAGANFLINAAAPSKASSRKSKMSSFAPVNKFTSNIESPTSENPTSKPFLLSQPLVDKSSLRPPSGIFGDLIDPVQILIQMGLIILTIAGLGGSLYWLGNLKYDTTAFQKVALDGNFKLPKKWRLNQGAKIDQEKLIHAHSVNQANYVSVLKEQLFGDADITVETNLTQPSSDLSFGIAAKINGKNNQNFYYLLVQPDGSFAMGKRNQENWDNKVNWRKSSAIALGEAPNLLRIVCKDNLVIGFINNQRVASFEDDQYSSGQVGLISYQTGGSESTVRFNKLLIKEKEITENEAQPSPQEAIQKYYKKLANSDEHKSFNFVDQTKIDFQEILEKTVNTAKVKVGLRYSLKNGTKICESRVMSLVFDPKIYQWKIEKSEDIRSQPTCP